MNLIFRNILAGIGSFPLIISFIIGMSIASGINTHYILIPIIITNIIGTILNPKDNTFYQLPVGLMVLLLSILYDQTLDLSEPNLGSAIMLIIPGIVFVALSFIPVKFSLVPVSTVVTVSLGIGIIIVLKQLPHAFGVDPIEQFKTLSAMNWIQFFLALLIPMLALIGNRYYKHEQILLLSFITISLLAFFIPVELHLYELEQFHVEQVIIQNWSINFIELKSALTNGIVISVILLCYFWGDLSAISRHGISNETSIKKSLRTVGLGNLIGSLFGVIPTNVSLIETTVISENKGNNKITLYTIIVLLSICVFVRVPSFTFPLFPIAGLIIYIGVRLIFHSFRILKGKDTVNYIIGVLGCVIILFLDYMYGFVFSLVCGLIYEAVTRKKATQ